MSDLVEQIRGYARLPQGWCYGAGGPIPKSSIDRAIQLYREILTSLNPKRAKAFPGTSGEIQIVAYCGNDRLEYTLEVDGSVTLYHTSGDTEVEFEDGKERSRE